MDITLYISRFIYRIRHQLVFGTLIITALVAYFSQFLEKYLQPIITQYFIDNKSEIWLLFLIAHSKR